MARIYRPHIPLSVRVQVATRDLARLNPYAWVSPDQADCHRLAKLLWALAEVIGCTVKDLRLDHDPPLAARPRRGVGKKTRYTPAANEPTCLNYRPHGPQFEGSHLIKTNTRGDGAQYPDRVLIKRERNRREGKKGRAKKRHTNPSSRKFKKSWPSRPFAKRSKS